MTNVGTLDRSIRIIIGILLLSSAVVVKDQIGWLGLLGFIPLLSGIFGNCPLYAFFGINTCAQHSVKFVSCGARTEPRRAP